MKRQQRQEVLSAIQKELWAAQTINEKYRSNRHLLRLIKEQIGVDDRTIKKHIQMMIDLGMIEGKNIETRKKKGEAQRVEDLLHPDNIWYIYEPEEIKQRSFGEFKEHADNFMEAALQIKKLREEKEKAKKEQIENPVKSIDNNNVVSKLTEEERKILYDKDEEK